MKQRKIEDIDTIIIHCSGSNYGTASLIRDWHVDGNGWEDIGYHYVIRNCYPLYENYYFNKPVPKYGGFIESGRSLESVGAHCRQYNKKSIGICLIGSDIFSETQIENLIKLIRQLKHNIPTIKHIKGHCEYTSSKTCPNLDMNYIRKMI